MSALRNLVLVTAFALLYFSRWYGAYVTSPEFLTAKAYVESSEEIDRLVGGGVGTYGLPTGWIFRRDGMAYFKVRVRGTTGAIRVSIDIVGADDEWHVVEASYVGPAGSGELVTEHRGDRRASLTSIEAGYALVQRGYPEEALEELDRAVDQDSLYAPAWLWRAAVQESLSRPDRASEDYRRVLELDPENREARTAMAELADHRRDCGARDEGCFPEWHR